MSLRAAAVLFACTLACPIPALSAPELPPSPYAILGSQLLAPPPLDAIPICIPARLSLQLGDFETAMGEGDFEAAGKWLDDYEGTIAIQDPEEHTRDAAFLRAAYAARSASERGDRNSALDRLQQVSKRDKEPERLNCALIESARLLVALRRLPEAEAATGQILEQRSWLGDDHPCVLAARFFRAESLYRRGDDFDAHLLYRELAGSRVPRLAAAARLRLTDLSFDAGKSRSVQIEYETLLPHGEAFGARMTDWSLRVSEAALDAGNYGRSAAWLDRDLEENEDSDVRDVVELRRADLDTLQGRPDEAVRRLQGLWAEEKAPDIRALARVRSIDLGVSSEAPDVRIQRLHDATASRNRRVRIYALAVMVHELVLLGRIDEGIAAVTRLAYEGADPVLARHFALDLSALLERARAELDVGEENGCQILIRRLGGRYGVLLDRAREVEPFLALGGCFEKLGFYDLAVEFYRSLTRTFGSSVVPRVALPLARTSLESGDPALARAAAEVNLQHGGSQAFEWKALLARAEAALGHDDKARDLLRDLLSRNVVPDQRVSLAMLFAHLLDGRPYDADTVLLIRTLDGTPQKLRDRDATAFAAANMRTAQILRRQGRLDAATRFYAVAARGLPQGARREEARFWGMQASGATTAADSGAIGPWARLARYDEAERSLERTHQLRADR